MTPELRWLAPEGGLLTEIPRALQTELLDAGSLTARARELADGEVSVELLRHDYALPRGEEAERLGIDSGTEVLLRDIHLFGGSVATVPWVFAHTVIPKGTLSGEGERLGRLGNKPLGEALFADPDIRRSGLQIAKLFPGDELFPVACAKLDELPAFIWGRRSAFRLSSGSSLLVAEFFLPSHPALSGCLAE